MIKQLTSRTRRLNLAALAGSLCYGMLAGSAALADDTEIFFPAELIQEDDSTVRPNILFMMDTSGSMGFAAPAPNADKTRMEVVREGLLEVLNTLPSTVNIGMGRLSSIEGGAILWPVSEIDASVESVYPGINNVVVGVSPAATTDRAQQIISTVTLDPSELSVGNLAAASDGGKDLLISTSAEEAEQQASGTVLVGATRTNNDLRMKRQSGGNSTHYGLSFRGTQALNLPANTAFSSAILELTCKNNSETTNRSDEFITIRGHASTNSPAFSTANNNLGSRGTTGSVSYNFNSTERQCNSVGKKIQLDVTSVVNAIRSQAGWTDSSPITLIIETAVFNGTASRQRTFQGVLASTANAPKLKVSYTAAPYTGARQFGLRFPGINIPRGVTIVDATLSFTGKPGSGAQQLPLNVDIGIQDSANAPAFAAANNNVSSRTSAGTVSWTVPVFTTNQEAVSSPQLKDLLNAVIKDSATWCGGSSLAFTFRQASGDGVRVFHKPGDTDTSDGELGPQLSLTYSSTDAALNTGCQANSSNVSVSQSSGDAEQNANGTANAVTNEDTLDLGYQTVLLSNVKQVVGLRFPAVPIPRNATITSAKLQFRASSGDSTSLSLRIRGHNVGDAPNFSTGGNDRPVQRLNSATTAQVAWNNVANWSSGSNYQSPDISSIIQEIVNRGDWTKGSNLAVMIEATSASGRRRATSRDSSSSNQPRLLIEFEAPPGAAVSLTVRNYLKQVVNGFPTSGGTPLPEQIFEAARYFRGEAVHFGRTRGDGFETDDGDDGLGNVVSASARISHPSTYTGGSTSLPAGCTFGNYSSAACAGERITGSAVYKSPFTDQACSANSLVILSDGVPNSNEASSRTLMQQMIGGSCDRVDGGDGGSTAKNDHGGTCAKEMAKYLFENDQSNIDGLQTVRTYAIGFSATDALKAYLGSVTAAGGGEFFSANDSGSIVSAFQEIVSDMLDIGTTFVSPAVTVNTFNRLTTRNELYFALFRPQPQARWEGNLKRYKLGGSPPIIQDADSIAAVDASTGFFKKTARSFWTPAGTDDGDEVAKGGAVGVFPATRSVFTYTGTSTALDAGSDTAPAEVTLSETANVLTETNAAVTKSLLGDAEMSDADRTNIIKFSRGVDVLDEDGDGSTTDVRNSMGDPLHSEPVLLTYGGTAINPDLTVFVGTNEGALHAFNAQTGVEQFAFVPQELLPNLSTYYRNTSGYLSRPYGVDGLITGFVPDPFAAITSSNKATLYVGLRMGGRQYYALDVTDRSNPKLKFVIRGDGSGKYRELGQTWSRVSNAKIKFNNAVRQVIIFTGGYDVSQDDKTTPTSSVDSMGRAVYIADAVTGERLWWGGIDPDALSDNPDVAVPAMQYSVPASPRAVDLDGDGLVDRIYIVDVAGQVFRFILNPANTGSANLVPAANWRKIAQLGGGATAANGRRFYSAPDIAIIRQNVSAPFLSISLGSGHRGHPLEEGTQDRFYVLRDPDELVGENTSTLFITDMQNVPASGDQPNLYDASDDLISSDDEDISGPALEALSAAKGFYIDLPAGGEKSLNESQTFDGKVLFTTYQPAATLGESACQASTGLSRFYALSIRDGSPVFNLDGTGTDDDLTTSDRSRELGTQGLPPNLAILYPPAPDGEDPTALIGVGPELIPVELDIPIKKTYWIKRR